MIKREFKINLKSFIIWTSILIGMFLIVFLVYPYMMTDDSMKSLDEMMKVFPPDLLKAFNMDLASINTAYGWLKSEGFMFALLIIGIYSSSLGLNIVLKEEYDKTIEYLGFLPITRSKIMTNKIIVAITYIALMVVTVGVFNYIALLLSGDFNQKQYLLLSITPLFTALPLFGIGLFISTFMRKSKKVLGIGLGIVFLSYFINVISELSDKVSFLKYLSLYTLSDVRNVISSVSLNPLTIIISICITIGFISSSYYRYERKELV